MSMDEIVAWTIIGLSTLSFLAYVVTSEWGHRKATRPLVCDVCKEHLFHCPCDKCEARRWRA